MKLDLTITAARVVGHAGCGFVDYADGTGEFRTDLPELEDLSTPRSRALRQRRVAQRASLREFSDYLGLKPSALSALERGTATVPDDQWTLIEEALTRREETTR